MGLGSLQTRMLIEFPQAFRNMLPIILAQIVVLLKDTALGYIVGLLALPRAGELLAEFFGRSQYYFSIFLVMVGMFLILNLSISFLARRLGRRRHINSKSVIMLRDDE
jgi:glutamate transport system permease protein